MKFVLSLRTGGLMEDPNWHYGQIETIEAPNLRDAKDKYAEKLGLLKDTTWDAETQTLWGWEIVDMIEEMKSKQM